MLKLNNLAKLIVLGVLSWLLVGATPLPPNPRVLMDIMKVTIGWTWARGTGADAQGFRIYCSASGNLSAPSITGQVMTDVQLVEVPDKTARNYLIGPVILQILNIYGVKTPTYGDLAQVTCVVSPYNLAGESTDGVAGSPRPVTSTFFQIRS